MDSNEIQIIDYSPEYKEAFRKLNYEWITKYFTLEHEDIFQLNNPEEYIIKPGGAILMAKLGEEIIGTCGLVKINETTFELVKMSVTEKARGLKAGYYLGLGIIQKAKELKASRIQLETNSDLIPAINLYKKLGFRNTDLGHSEYKRCDVKMILDLK